MSEQLQPKPETVIDDIDEARAMANAMHKRMSKAAGLRKYLKKIAQDPDGIHHHIYREDIGPDRMYSRHGEFAAKLPEDGATDMPPESYDTIDTEYRRSIGEYLDSAYGDIFEQHERIARSKEDPIPYPNKEVVKHLGYLVDDRERQAAYRGQDAQEKYLRKQKLEQLESELLAQVSLYTSEEYEDADDSDSAVYKRIGLLERVRDRKSLVESITAALGVSPESLSQEQRVAIINATENYVGYQYGGELYSLEHFMESETGGFPEEIEERDFEF